MPEFYISKIKLRRGTNAQRVDVTLDQGEPAFTTDTQRLYIGNGSAKGGISVTTKNHTPLTDETQLTQNYAEKGDIVSINNIWYQLTAIPYDTPSNWAKLATKVSQEFEYDATSTINIKINSLSASKLNMNTINNGLSVIDGKLGINFDSAFFTIDSNKKFSLANNSITRNQINENSFGDGLSGGNGDQITLKVNRTNFDFTDGVLQAKYDSLSSTTFFLPQTNTSNIVGQKIRDVATVDGVLYQYNGSQWLDIGNRKGLQRSVYSTLTCLSAFSGASGFSPQLSSLFNGRPSHAIINNGAIPGTKISIFRTLSANGTSTVVVDLSSAGFITFEGNSESKTSQPFGRFAIPIFAY